MKVKSIAIALFFSVCAHLFAQVTDSTLVLPPVIYAVEGIETRIEYDNVIHYPDEYQVLVECEVGVAGGGSWTFTPTVEDEGVYPLQMTLLSPDDEVIRQSETIIAVTPSAINEHPLKLMVIGDSLSDDGKYQLQFANRMDAAGITYSTLGTVTRNDLNFEALRGNTFEKYYEGPHYYSPFIYWDTGFDPERYFAERLSGVTPSLFIIFLGINDTFSASRGSDSAIETRLDEVLERAVRFVEGLRSAAPGSDAAIVLTPAGSSQQSNFDAAYGENTFTPEQWQAMRQKLVSRFIDTFGNREEEGLFLIPASIGLDRIGDYSETQAVHPNDSGYLKIGDIMYAWMNYYLQKSAYPRWALNELARETILNGKGNFLDNPDNDLFSNFVEYAFVTDPSTFTSNLIIFDENGLFFRQRHSVTAQLKVSNDLSAWSDWSGEFVDTETDGVITRSVAFDAFLPDASGAVFWHINYTDSP